MAVALLAGCTAEQDTAERDLLLEQAAVVEALQQQGAELEGRITTTITSTSMAPPPTTTTAEPVPEAAEVFAAASPSLVFIEVPDGTGSGIVLADGWVLTNAHVVGRCPAFLVAGLTGHPIPGLVDGDAPGG